MLGAILSGAKVEINPDSLRTAFWLRPDEELPKEPGFYLVLTNEHLAKGIAWYGESLEENPDDDGKWKFDIIWAEHGKDPKVYYWLKDNLWGLVYEFKKVSGEIG